MNKRLITVVMFAVVVAGLATLLFYKLVAGRLSAEPKPVATTKIWVASRNLPVGTLIQSPDVTEAPWVGPIPAGAVQKKDDWLLRGVTTTIYQGEPIIGARLAPKGAGAGLAATIPSGYRAVAVRVNEIIGLAGFVVPGQHVDVLISGMPPSGSAANGTLSRTLLQDVEVLSAGQNLEKDPEGKPISVTVVNLLVTPKDAELLSLASTETKIQLVLRNPIDKETMKTPGTSVASLFSGAVYSGGQAAPGRPRVVKPAVILPVVKQPAPVVVEVIQGNTRSTVKFTEESQ
jgi:pilus assembly protein CpaB